MANKPKDPGSWTVAELAAMDFDQMLKNTSCCNFYDWFCDARQLARRAKPMHSFIKSIVKSGCDQVIDVDETYVVFRNCQPGCSRVTYDEIIFSVKDSNRVAYNVSLRNFWYDGRPVVAYPGSAEVDRFNMPLVFDDVRHLKKWIADPGLFAVMPSHSSTSRLGPVRIDTPVAIEKALGTAKVFDYMRSTRPASEREALKNYRKGAK